MPELKVKDLSIGTLVRISFSLKPGRITCISGPSGSGKSRLLRAIADLESHAGDILLDNKPQGAYPAHHWRRRVILVPAQSAWWGDTVGEHFLTPMPRALLALGFPEDTEKWQVNRLSSGEKQRLALVRALSYRPQALLLDEPTANLDVDTTQEVERWLIALIEKHRYPTIWVAHSREQIQRIAHRHLTIVGDQLEEQEIHR
ncbi:ATP-binding cassette domain-containing protein [Microbulbifer sp. OS29]|uniref:ATP-binding cassette domain-containing protein n=1 Tax=Microbulbifer okhotskensis TaxID=2926617 RepID=A0A9X2ERW7_9GAMM|nr:ATP-binding cassette domain-containing protein [Microbulbifer okhotskensis]MCO1334611.1 ATP-binding cassette domain-containing protein [Microbulbifer okhotskensis]